MQRTGFKRGMPFNTAVGQPYWQIQGNVGQQFPHQSNVRHRIAVNGLNQRYQEQQESSRQLMTIEKTQPILTKLLDEILALEPPPIFAEENSAFNSILVVPDEKTYQTPDQLDTQLNTSFSGELFITR